jgi:hypothetical protein
MEATTKSERSIARQVFDESVMGEPPIARYAQSVRPGSGPK